jgi:hypothetical protein
MEPTPGLEIHHRVQTGIKSLLLERRVGALTSSLEIKEAQLGEVLAAAHLDPGTLQQVGGGGLAGCRSLPFLLAPTSTSTSSFMERPSFPPPKKNP